MWHTKKSIMQFLEFPMEVAKIYSVQEDGTDLSELADIADFSNQAQKNIQWWQCPMSQSAGGLMHIFLRLSTWRMQRAAERQAALGKLKSGVWHARCFCACKQITTVTQPFTNRCEHDPTEKRAFLVWSSISMKLDLCQKKQTKLLQFQTKIGILENIKLISCFFTRASPLAN